MHGDFHWFPARCFFETSVHRSPNHSWDFSPGKGHALKWSGRTLPRAITTCAILFQDEGINQKKWSPTGPLSQMTIRWQEMKMCAILLDLLWSQLAAILCFSPGGENKVTLEMSLWTMPRHLSESYFSLIALEETMASVRHWGQPKHF